MSVLVCFILLFVVVIAVLLSRPRALVSINFNSSGGARAGLSSVFRAARFLFISRALVFSLSAQVQRVVFSPDSAARFVTCVCMCVCAFCA